MIQHPVPDYWSLGRSEVESEQPQQCGHSSSYKGAQADSLHHLFIVDALRLDGQEDGGNCRAYCQRDNPDGNGERSQPGIHERYRPLSVAYRKLATGYCCRTGSQQKRSDEACDPKGISPESPHRKNAAEVRAESEGSAT